jgi:protein required for attachment to host cells
MKKALLALPLTLAITACGTFNKNPETSKVTIPDAISEQRSIKEIEPASQKPVDLQAANVANSIPVWFLQTPQQEGYIFGTGTGRSRDLGMAKEKALSEAQGKIAEAVDGKVTKQTKVFKTEAGSNVIENSSTVTKKTAINVNFTGTEVREVVVRLEPGGQYRTFVLVALPLGENNQVLKQQMDAVLTREIIRNESVQMKELENSEQPEAPNRMLGEQPKPDVSVIPPQQPAMSYIEQREVPGVDGAVSASN